MSVKVHRLFNPAVPTNQGIYGQRYLVDISSFATANNVDIAGMVFPLDEDSRYITEALNNTTVITSERFTTNTYPSTSTYVYFMDQSGSGTSVVKTMWISLATAIDGQGHTYGSYLNTLPNRIYISGVTPVAPGANPVTSPGQLLVAVGQSTSSTFETLNDTLIIYNKNANGLDPFMYTLFSGFTTTYSIADINVNSEYVLVNDPSNGSDIINGAVSSNLVNLGPDMEPAAPQQAPGGFIFRIVAQTANIGQSVGSATALVKSSDVVMVLVYKLDTTNQTYTYRTQTSINDTVHPLILSNPSLMTGYSTATNFLIFPTNMTVQEAYQIANFGSFVDDAKVSYYFNTPTAAMFPDIYPDNTFKIAQQTFNAYTAPGVCYPFAQYDVLTLEPLVFESDITTMYSFFNVFLYNQQQPAISINGIDINPLGQQTTVTVSSQSVNAWSIQLTSPVNKVKVSFWDPLNNKNVVTETIIRLKADGSQNPSGSYFNAGVWFVELASEPATSPGLFYSYVDQTATLGYTDNYGTYVPPTVTLTGTYLAGPKEEFINIGETGVFFYGKIQGYYKPATSTVVGFQSPTNLGGSNVVTGQVTIEIDPDGWLRTSNATIGQYVLYVLTSRGHVALTLNVNAAEGSSISTEYTFYTFAGVPIDLWEVLGANAPQTYGTPSVITSPPAPPYIENGLLYAQATTRFQVADFVFNVTILPTPAFLATSPSSPPNSSLPSVGPTSPTGAQPLTIKVMAGATYDLSSLLGLDDRLANTMFFATSGLLADATAGTTYASGSYHSKGTFSWAAAGSTTNVPLNAVYVGAGSSTKNVPNTASLLVANIVVVAFQAGQPTSSTILARVGDKFDLWNHIEPFSDTSILRSVQDTSNTDGLGISSLPDGTITINEVPTGTINVNFIANVVLLGVHIPIPMTVLILSNSALSVYMTRSAVFQVAASELVSGKGKLNLITNKGDRVSIRQAALSSQAYNGDDVDITWNSGGAPYTGFTGFVLGNVKKPILITYTNGSLTSPVVHQVALNPFGTLSTKEQYAVLDKNKKATITTLPVGPEYQIFAVNSGGSATGSALFSFTGGIFSFDPSGANDFMIVVPEYNAPDDNFVTEASSYPTWLLQIPLKIVQGEDLTLYVVNSNTIQNVQAIISPQPSWTSPNPFTTPGTLTVNRSSTSSMNQVILLQLQPTGSQITGTYVNYQVVFLPKVDISQTVLYVPTSKYEDVLPAYGYDYTNSGITLSNTVTAAPTSITAAYGELTITFNFRPFTGVSSTVGIYLSYTVPNATEVYPPDDSGSTFGTSKPLTLPYYTTGGLQISSSSAGITFTKSSSNVFVGEWFVYTPIVGSTPASTTLYIFDNIPTFVHQDVFIFDTTTGVASWTADNPFANATPVGANVYYKVSSSDPNAASYPNAFGYSQTASTFTFASGGKQVLIDAYYGFGATTTTYEMIPGAFSIYLESGLVIKLHVVGSGVPFTTTNLIPATQTIVSFTDDPTTFTTYSGQARLKTTNVRFTMATASGVNTLTFENDRPNSNDGERSTIYVKSTSIVPSGTASNMYIIEAYTHNVPYQGTIPVEIYNNFGPFPGYPSPIIPFDPNIVNMNYTPIGAAGSIPNSNTDPNPYTTVITAPNLSNTTTTPQAGSWTVTYDYYSPAYTGGTQPAYSGSFTLQLSVITYPAIADTYMIMPVGSTISRNVISDFFGGTLSTHRLDNVNINGNPFNAPTWQSGGAYVLTSSQSSPLGVEPAPYAVTFTISVNPSRIATTDSSAINTRSKNVKVGDVTIYPKINFQVYDPTQVPQYVLNATTGVFTPLATFNLITDGVGTTLKYVELNGVQLPSTTTHDKAAGFDWTTMSSATLASNTSQVNNFFFLTLEKGLSLVTTVILPATSPLVTLKSTTVGPTNFDLLALCFPTLAGALEDAGLGHDPVTDKDYYITPAPDNTAVGYPISGFTTTLTPLSPVIQYLFSGLVLSTFNLSLLLVNTPLPPGPLAFTVPINTKFNLTSEAVNAASQMLGGANATAPLYVLSVDPLAQSVSGSNTALYAVNDPTDGIDVDFPASGEYSIGGLLTNSGLATLSVNINFYAYDPANTQNYNIVSYSGSDQQTLPGAFINYSVDGVNYGTASNQFCTVVGASSSTPSVTMTAGAASPRHVFIFTLAQPTTDVDNNMKNVIIYNFVFVTIVGIPKTIYLIKGESKSISAQDVTTASPNAQIGFDPTGLLPSGSGIIYPNNAGTPVGYVTGYATPAPKPGATISIVGNEPGTWDNFVVDIYDFDTRTNTTNNAVVDLAQNPAVVIPVTVITLASLLMSGLPVFIFQIGQPVWVDLTQYIVNHLTASWTNWLMNGAAVPGNLNGDLSEGVIQGTFTITGSYVFTGTITSQEHSALTSNFTVTLVLYDPTTTSPLAAFVENLLPTTIITTASIASIDGTSVNGSTAGATYKDGSVQFTFNGTQTTIQALATLPTEQTYTLVLSDGNSVLLTLTQTASNSNTVVASQSYSGQLFNATQGTTVVSYIISGQSGTYYPNIQYTLPNGGSVTISTNGTYTINSGTLPSGATPTPTTFVVTYTGSSSGSVSLVFQGNNPDTVYVEQPTYQLTLPSTVTRVLINGYPLVEASPLVLAYAKFIWAGTVLSVENISSSFENTDVQVESSGANVQVLDYLLVLAVGVNAVVNLAIPTQTTVTYNIGFTPTSISYDGATFKGSVASSNIIVQQTNVGSFTFDGTILTVTSGPKSVYVQLIGFAASDGTTTYYRIQFDSTIVPISVLPTQVLPYTSPIGVVGDSLGNQIFPTALNTPATLSNDKLTITTQSVTVLQFPLTAPYSFYVTLLNGTTFVYTVTFQMIDIIVSSFTRFPTLAITPLATNLVFSNPGVSVANGIVLNPAGLGGLTLTSPFNAVVTLHSA